MPLTLNNGYLSVRHMFMHTNFNEHIQAYTLGFIVIANAPRHTNTHLHQVMTQFVGVMLVLDRFPLQRLVVKSKFV